MKDWAEHRAPPFVRPIGSDTTFSVRNKSRIVVADHHRGLIRS